MIINTVSESSGGLKNVYINEATLANGQTLKYNASSGMWENADAASYTETPAPVGGGTVATITT